MTSSLPECTTGARDGTHPPGPTDALDLLADFRNELQEISAVQRALIEELRSDGVINLDVEEELSRLRQENSELRVKVEQLERRARYGAPTEDAWAERQSEYEKLLDEKSEVIRTLHLQVQELRVTTATAAAPEEIRDAVIERQRKELEAQRGQLEEDEVNMMEQMRGMELALAKDRADLARQRGEVQRQQADHAREVEMAGRDPQLRDRLANLQRRQTDTVRKPVDGAGVQLPPPPPVLPPKQSSGLIRRLFG
jgi:chromosome segregation ATPase